MLLLGLASLYKSSYYYPNLDIFASKEPHIEVLDHTCSDGQIACYTSGVITLRPTRAGRHHCSLRRDKIKRSAWEIHGDIIKVSGLGPGAADHPLKDLQNAGKGPS